MTTKDFEDRLKLERLELAVSVAIRNYTIYRMELFGETSEDLNQVKNCEKQIKKAEQNIDLASFLMSVQTKIENLKDD